MSLKNLVLKYFKKSSQDTSDHKLDVYECQSCGKHYAYHTTRMGNHLIECSDIPVDVKESVKFTLGRKNKKI